MGGHAQHAWWLVTRVPGDVGQLAEAGGDEVAVVTRGSDWRPGKLTGVMSGGIWPATSGLACYLGLGLALVAVVLVGFVRERGAVRPSGRGLAMAVGSGAMIGLFLVLIEQAPHDSGMIPLLFKRGVNALLMLATLVGL